MHHIKTLHHVHEHVQMDHETLQMNGKLATLHNEPQIK